MFTGVIEELGQVDTLSPRAAGTRLRVRCRQIVEGLAEGESVAVNGVCLTAVELRPDSFAADVAPETLRRSNLGRLAPGSKVNLERALRASARLNGHIVQGHVDGTGEIVSLDLLGDENWWLRVRVPAGLHRYLVEKGSIALDGISLTIAAVSEDVVSATIIPHTYRNTTLQGYRKGSLVNVECDILAKHIEKLLQVSGRKASLSVERLEEMGY